MATILNDAAYMGFPLSIKRGNPAPVDTTAVWYDKTELETYAASGATAYVGQIVTLYADNKCEAYMISNEAGTLIKLASTTASGDLTSDVATLQGQVADLIDKVGAKAEGETTATGLYKEIADVLAVANSKVSSVAAADKSVAIGGSITAPTVKVAIASGSDNALTLASDGLKVVIPEVSIPEYSVIKKTDSGNYAAVYQLTKDNTPVGVDINIPKDMVVESGTIETYTEGHLPTGVKTAGTYIVLKLANAANDTLYIPVDSLIEYVTGGTATDGIISVNVDPDTHVCTATINDGTITEAKLVKAVTDKLAKAVSAVQAVTESTKNGNISVDDTDVAVHGLQDAAYATVDSLNTTAQGYVDTAKAALIGNEDDNDGANTIYGAKKYAKEVAASAKNDAVNDAKTLVNNLTLADAEVEKKLVSAVKQTNGQIEVTRRELVAADIPTLAISKIDGLQTALDGKQASLTFDGAYNAATNKAATVSTVNTAVTNVISNGKDVAADDTIKGAKLYADSKATAAETAAKEYADSIVTGTGGITARVEALETKVDVTKVSTAISTAKQEAIDAAASDASTKDAALKKAILGSEETDYAQTVKSAYDLAATKTTMAAVEAKNYATKTEAQGYADAKDTAIAEAKKTGTDAAAAAKTAQDGVNSLKTLVGTLPESATASTIVGYVDEKIGAIPAQTDYTVSVTESTPSGYAKAYTIKQLGKEITTINIPKDMVVESGTVETKTTTGDWGAAGTYLVLTLANATSDKVYINVGDLIEYVTGGEASDGIITTSVDANHVLTATIGDGTITKAKLATAIQTSLGKADSALQAAALNDYAKTAEVEAGYVAKNGTDRLMTAAEGTKLSGIDTGAQVNKIESIKVGTTALTIGTDKSVALPTATAAQLGLIKVDNTSIAVDANGTISVKAVSTDKLSQGSDTLIFNCGGASTLG